MKKLLNALKGINKFGLALMLVAGVLVFTQSAFTAQEVKNDEWGQYTGPTTSDLVNGQWYRTVDLPSGYQEVCNEPLSSACKFQFDGDPNDGGMETGESLIRGQYDIVEIP